MVAIENTLDFQSVKDDCIRKIEAIVTTLTMVELDHAFTPKGSVVDFGENLNNLRNVAIDLYKQIRHKDVNLDKINEVDYSVEQMYLVYKPVLDQCIDYVKSRHLI